MAFRRFRGTGGQTRVGATPLGRWIRAAVIDGMDLLKGINGKALNEFSLMWSDVMKQEIVPIVEVHELVEALLGQHEMRSSGPPTLTCNSDCGRVSLA